MYRSASSRPSVRPLFFVILLGVLAGAVFLVTRPAEEPTLSREDQIATAAAAVSTPTVPAEVVAVDVPPTPEIHSFPTGIPPQRVQLTIPTAGVAAPIIQVYLDETGTWNVSQLGNFIGHLQGTGWLERTGNIALAGHVELADGSPGIFARLDELRTGDLIYLAPDNAEQRTYAITSVRRVDPADLSVLYPTPADTLTLITCDNYDFLTNTYADRIVVTATRLS